MNGRRMLSSQLWGFCHTIRHGTASQDWCFVLRHDFDYCDLLNSLVLRGGDRDGDCGIRAG
jgi:hypothetical protein